MSGFTISTGVSCTSCPPVAPHCVDGLCGKYYWMHNWVHVVYNYGVCLCAPSVLENFFYDVNGETVCVFMYNVMRTMFMLFSDTC